MPRRRRGKKSAASGGGGGISWALPAIGAALLPGILFAANKYLGTNPSAPAKAAAAAEPEIDLKAPGPVALSLGAAPERLWFDEYHRDRSPEKTTLTNRERRWVEEKYRDQEEKTLSSGWSGYYDPFASDPFVEKSAPKRRKAGVKSLSLKRRGRSPLNLGYKAYSEGAKSPLSESYASEYLPSEIPSFVPQGPFVPEERIPSQRRSLGYVSAAKSRNSHRLSAPAAIELEREWRNPNMLRLPGQKERSYSSDEEGSDFVPISSSASSSEKPKKSTSEERMLKLAEEMRKRALRQFGRRT